jgi:hypothetical protein
LQRQAGTQFDAESVAALTAAVLASEPAPAVPASSS